MMAPGSNMTELESAQLKLYLVNRIDENSYEYDDWIGFIVNAENEEQSIALTTSRFNYAHSGWPSADKLKSTLIGISLLNEIGIVFDSFNSG